MLGILGCEADPLGCYKQASSVPDTLQEENQTLVIEQLEYAYYEWLLKTRIS